MSAVSPTPTFHWRFAVLSILVVALGLTSLTSVAYGAFLMWAFVG